MKRTQLRFPLQIQSRLQPADLFHRHYYHHRYHRPPTLPSHHTHHKRTLATSNRLIKNNHHRHHPHPLLNIHPEVQEAIQTNKPVVALESTILSHGLPYPDNLHLSNDISKILRMKGVIPATVAVKNGVCCVGLTQEDIHDLVVVAAAGGGHGDDDDDDDAEKSRATKCSTRDLPFLMKNYCDQERNDGKHYWGATTVASTMRIAHLAGLSTFVTGGTGGVHGGAETSMDVSADLLELSRTPVIVISAGIKSILDIPKTLEVLETYGVPTASYQSDEFPAFFSPSSGVRTPMRVDTAEDVANAYFASLDLGLDNGMLVAVPNYDPAGANVEDAIQETLQEAERLGIQGRDVTPYILKKVSERTDGDSLRSNTALVKHNAQVGADIALAVAKYKEERRKYDANSYQISSAWDEIYCSTNNESPKMKSKVVVVGGSVIDIVAKSKNRIIPSTSNPGSCTESDGGVGRNIAEVLGQLGTKPLLFTAVGDDSRGKALRQRMEDVYDIPASRQYIKVVPNSNTATYLATLDSDGDLHNAIADMDVLSEIPMPNHDTLSDAKYLVIDANAPAEKLVQAVQMAKSCGTLVIFDPTSVPKAALLKGNTQFLSCVSFAFPNLDELLALTDNCSIRKDIILKDDNSFETLKFLASQLLRSMHPKTAHLIVTLGSNGVFSACKDANNEIRYKHFPVKAKASIENCTGAGDTMVGVFVKCLLDGYTVHQSIEKGMIASLESINNAHSAIPKFSQDVLIKIFGAESLR